MNDRQLKAVSALAELERAGVNYDTVNDSEVKVKCPFHSDHTPSCSINLEKNVFKCYAAGCGAKGDFLTFLAKLLNTTRRVVWEDLSKRYSMDSAKVINSQVIERWHEAVWSASPLLKELYARGVTDAMIRKYRIGYDGSRITIPVTNTEGSYVNVRCYLPGAPSHEKMKNRKGHGKPLRLFPIEQLKYETVVVCGGELKAVVTAEKINKYNIGAITATAGEGNWDVKFNELFKGKKVYVCLDIDDAGRKAAQTLCARLKSVVSFIGDVELPLSIDEYPKGDVNDYFGQEKKTAKDFMALLEMTSEWIPSTRLMVEDSPIIDVPLAHASRAEHTGRRLRLFSNVAAMDTAPYVIPKKVKITCDRSQEGCIMCPVFTETPDNNGIVVLEIHPESPAVLDMVAASKSVQRDAIMEGLRIPTCKSVDFVPFEYYNVEDLRLSPQLEIASRAVDDVLQPALCIGHGIETNEAYEFVGRMYPHPKTQQSVLLISEAKAVQDALSNYSPSNGELSNLEWFQPKEWTVEGIEAKMMSLYDDLAANVTHIYQRMRLHLAIDLAYHSVLLFEFDGKVTKGWTEILIAGDSAQGKTETVMRLMQHYGLGERIECKNATVAGLLGGLQQIGSRWFVTWGVIPAHDKRLVVLEEIKGTSTEVLGKLTDMRSSGIAEIPKIEKRRTHARTRLIMISNPRSDRPLSMYNFGIEAIRELIGSPEDIRRFDMSLLLASSEIDANALNLLQQYRPVVKNHATSQRCRALVLWAWTRLPSQVIIDDDTKALILRDATAMCNSYTELIPIVDRGSMRFKIARLAIALACRTFSHRDQACVVVQPCHVEYIVKLLHSIYSDKIFGYKDFSEAINVHNSMSSPDIVSNRILQTPFPHDFVKQMLYTNEIELRDICDWCGWEKGEAVQLMSLLVRKHALVRDGRSYRKTASFIEFLKDLSSSEKMKTFDRPDHIAEEF
jgi:hypothetical protein